MAAGVVYAALTVWIYLPHLNNFNRVEYIYLINSVIAGMGCVLLFNRWLFSGICGFFAGAVYALGPYFLIFGKFHPSAGFAVAALPWLFLPAVYCPRRWVLPKAVFFSVPFLFIPSFFTISVRYGLFAMPLNSQLKAPDLMGLIFPLFSTVKNNLVFGYYHVAVPLLVIGFVMIIKARRWWLIGVFIAGVVLAVARPMLQVSPVVWLSFSVLCGAGAVGLGMEGLIEAGFPDRKWVSGQIILLGFFEIVALYYFLRCDSIFLGLGKKCADIFWLEAKLYAIGLAALIIVYLLIKKRVRQHWLRWAVILTALGFDIYLSSTFIVDKIF